MLPAISPAVISHLAMPNSGVRRYAAALQSLVSAGARDRLARAEEPVVRRLCAGGGSQLRTRLWNPDFNVSKKENGRRKARILRLFNDYKFFRRAPLGASSSMLARFFGDFGRSERRFGAHRAWPIQQRI